MEEGFLEEGAPQRSPRQELTWQGLQAGDAGRQVPSAVRWEVGGQGCACIARGLKRILAPSRLLGGTG